MWTTPLMRTSAFVPICAPIKDRRTSGKKDTIFHNASCQIRMRSHQNSIAQTSGEARCSTNDSMFHNDAVGSNLYWATFRYKRCPKEDAAIFPNRDITTDRGCWSYISR
jgi:hypothetical protein